MEKFITKICKQHGKTEFIFENRGYYRCKKCRSMRVQNRRTALKKLAVEYKGGKCIQCGYDKCEAALEFHHLDPTQKDFHFGQRGHTRSWKRVKKEIDKCIIVCANCHREIHYSQQAKQGARTRLLSDD